MDLFLETPQQKADRILRQQQRLLEMQARAAVGPRGGSPDGHGDGGGLFDGEPSASMGEREPRPEDYSAQQDEYRQELDYDRRRSRRRTLRARLRALAMIVLVPLGLVGVFLVSYSLTCILNGATPSEVVQHLSNLVARLSSAIQTAFPSS